ncbi:MAG TPA: Uma2 family endonuclease [Rhizobiales bacterium]|nr:Uma2 family endonuclease [Hyphomicrobiales bacterium]
MNEHAAPSLSRAPATTQAAEGLPRRPWSVAEIEAMVAAGIIDEDERFELIGGQVVPMSPKGARHETVKIALNEFLQRAGLADVFVAPETTLRLDEKSFLEPDFCVFPRALSPGEMRGPDVLLAIEIADTSLAYDLGRKIEVYAAHGVAEVWVIDARSLRLRLHRGPGADGYGEIREIAPVESVAAGLVPGLTLSLAAIGLSPAKD